MKRCSIVGCERKFFCREVCRKHYIQLPDVRTKRIEYKRRFDKRPEWIVRRRAYMRVYSKKKEVQQRRTQYQRLPDVVARRVAYYSRPAVTVRLKEYRARPEVIVRKKAWAKVYHLNSYIKSSRQLLSSEEKNRRRREYRRMYRKRPDFKERNIRSQKKYLSKPGVKTRIQTRLKNYYALPAVKDRARRNAKRRRDTDPQCLIESLVSCRLRDALRKYAAGKQYSSSKYGVDYAAIYAKMGARPSKDHEVEHIIPSSAFDLTISGEVAMCFSPENLCWQLRKYNNQKSNYWCKDGKFFRGKNEIQINQIPMAAQEILGVI